MTMDIFINTSAYIYIIRNEFCLKAGTTLDMNNCTLAKHKCMHSPS